MSEYSKSYRIHDHDVTISWGATTPPVATWSPPITEEQRHAVENTEAWESLMMSFIGEAAAAIHGTEVVYLDPDTGQELKRIPPDKKKWSDGQSALCPAAVPDKRMRTRQVIGAPKHDRNAIRRYILQRWLEKDRQKIMALITSKPMADWLRASDLPDNIEIEDVPVGWKPSQKNLATYANDPSIWGLIII